ncbi:uncharacterized protein Z518_02258 [Rhinocladiella mackenziei CBS 650.93]|uniref:Rhinocladiella mackenziei CBS 650.93 unplaced genomic scaffold supercont1.2, whole genome shotgun sequence n=1 Tax=Rhinocladiella mackenziei CBS 650.93 TaxID=1442369 RepID=A0A0D2JEK0_9EURO|nr:uncharacterized protein Z518_02258 [Rhinocladiella mackenziei CBS 650.93]KIX07605.1 hypothetical protein Z518_02258 [Rhinocladiella mackenziei CBS 650.93]
MSSPAVQLSFTLRTSPNVRTVHLLGSWDNYKSQLPLSLVKDSSAKPGSWKGTFRFQGSNGLKLGSRYWYYYIVDGYHVSHDPAKEFVTEKTTGRKLNIIDVPGGDKDGGKAQRPTVTTSSLPGSRHSREIPQGRALSPGKIQHPKPSKPYASRQLREADYETSPVDDLEERFAGYRISDPSSASPSELSDDSSSSGTAFSRSSPSSMSSVSDHSCRCERYGVTRSGQRVKLDCGGKRCGAWSSSSSECDSHESEEESSADEREYRARQRREADKRGTAAIKGHSGGEERRRVVVIDKRRR